MVFNATYCYNNISVILWRSVLLVEETRVPGENQLRDMVFYATYNNISVISWRSVLLVEETRGPGENH